MHSLAEWMAEIPPEVTARDGLVMIKQALDDAAEATDQIRARYTGTVPPPPWPQHPELERAIAALEGGRLLLNQAIEAGYGDRKEPKTGPLATRLTNGGRALYREVDRMQKAMAGIKVEDIPGMIANAAKRAAGTSIGGLFAVAAILWALDNLGGGE